MSDYTKVRERIVEMLGKGGISGSETAWDWIRDAGLQDRFLPLAQLATGDRFVFLRTNEGTWEVANRDDSGSLSSGPWCVDVAFPGSTGKPFWGGTIIERTAKALEVTRD